MNDEERQTQLPVSGPPSVMRVQDDYATRRRAPRDGMERAGV